MNKGIISLQWPIAKEIYIPKVKPPTEHNISDFRPIALLNVEGKLFFSLVSRCLGTHLISVNKFINKYKMIVWKRFLDVVNIYLNGLSSSERSQI